MQEKEQQQGRAEFFSTLQQQVSVTSRKHWQHKHRVAPMSSWVGFTSTLRACRAPKYRPSLYKDAACVKNTKTFMSCWESCLLLLFILPIASPAAAQQWATFDHQAAWKHASMHAHTQAHIIRLMPSNQSSAIYRHAANVLELLMSNYSYSFMAQMKATLWIHTGSTILGM